MIDHPNVVAALRVLADLDLPRAQQNERSALTLLALLDLRPDREWSRAASPLMGITPIMDWMSAHYGKEYKPNTRETIRRQTMHQFVLAGIALYNPDNPARPVNSPAAVYQVSPEALSLFKSYGKTQWVKQLSAYRRTGQSLAERFARSREITYCSDAVMTRWMFGWFGSGRSSRPPVGQPGL